MGRSKKKSPIVPTTIPTTATSLPRIPPTSASLIISPLTQLPLKLICSLATFAISLAIYMITKAKTVTLVDSGELILTSANLGVAHPPGTPLYSMIGYLFSKIPIGSIASRLSLMSAVCAALTASMITLISLEIPLILNRSPKVKQASTNLVPPWPAVIAICVGLTLAYSKTLWYYAAVAEVYSLNILLLAVVVYLMIGWHLLREPQPKASEWFIAGAAGFYGLALGVHHVTIVLALPAIALFVLYTAGTKYMFSRALRLAPVAFIAMTATYLYLPLATRHAPILNWGNPDNWTRFYNHISAKQYQVFLTIDSSKIGSEVQYFLSLCWQQFTPLGIVLALIGLVVVWKYNRPFSALLSVIILCNTGYSILYTIDEDKDAYYLTTDFALSIAIVIACYYIFQQVVKQQRSKLLIIAIIILLPVLNFVSHYRENNKRNYLIAQDYVENTLRNIPPQGLLLTVDWQFYSPYLYLHHMEGLRPDAIVIDLNMLRRSWYIETYLQKQYPVLMTACQRETEAFLVDLKRFEADQPYDAQEINKHFIGLINAFIDYNLAQGHTSHAMLPMEPGIATKYSWIPQGLTVKFSTNKDFQPEPIVPLEFRGLMDGSVYHDEVVEKKILPSYAKMLANRGKYLSLGQQYNEALENVLLAIKLDNRFDRSYEFLGDIYAAQGKKSLAFQAFQQALMLNPANTNAQQKLQALSSPNEPANNPATQPNLPLPTPIAPK